MKLKSPVLLPTVEKTGDLDFRLYWWLLQPTGSIGTGASTGGILVFEKARSNKLLWDSSINVDNSVRL